MKSGFLAGAILVATLVATPALAEDITIAIAGPMTGDLAAFGDQLRKGAEKAVQDINASGGVLGKKLKLVLGDDQCDPKQAVQVANDLVNQKVAMVTGHFCSGASIPASDVYGEEGIIQITPSATNPALTDEGATKGITTLFRTCSRDDRQGVFAGDWLAKKYAGKKVAILDDKSAYGQGVADNVVKNMEAGGLKAAMRETYTQKQRDFSALLSKLKAAEIDAVFIGGYYNDIGLIVRQARDQGYQGQFIASDAVNSAEFWSISGPAGEGLIYPDAASAVNEPAAQEVVKRFRADNYEPEGYTLNSYAAIQAWAEAVAKVGTIDGAKVAAALHDGSYPTVIGNLSWDAKGDLKEVHYVWWGWHGGKASVEPNT